MYKLYFLSLSCQYLLDLTDNYIAITEINTLYRYWSVPNRIGCNVNKKVISVYRKRENMSAIKHDTLLHSLHFDTSLTRYNTA